MNDWAKDNYGDWDLIKTDEEKLRIAEERHSPGGWHGCCVCGDWLISEVRRLKAELQKAYQKFSDEMKEYGAQDTKDKEQLVMDARADEREACAKVVEDTGYDFLAKTIATAIRARGKK